MNTLRTTKEIKTYTKKYRTKEIHQEINTYRKNYITNKLRNK